MGKVLERGTGGGENPNIQVGELGWFLPPLLSHSSAFPKLTHAKHATQVISLCPHPIPIRKHYRLHFTDEGNEVQGGLTTCPNPCHR